jgi:predicted nucleic acid-binding protein
MLCFFDTNVLIYLFDKDSPNKAAVARQLYSRLVREKSGLVSVQVLQEFFVTLSKKFAVTLSPDDVEREVRDLSALLKVIETDVALVLDSVTLSRRYTLSFWDSLIIQAALRGGASVLYTEDLQDGQVFESLTVRNPFAGIRG